MFHTCALQSSNPISPSSMFLLSVSPLGLFIIHNSLSNSSHCRILVVNRSAHAIKVLQLVRLNLCSTLTPPAVKKLELLQSNETPPPLLPFIRDLIASTSVGLYLLDTDRERWHLYKQVEHIHVLLLPEPQLFLLLPPVRDVRLVFHNEQVAPSLDDVGGRTPRAFSRLRPATCSCAQIPERFSQT